MLLRKDSNAPFAFSLIVLEIEEFLSMILDTLNLSCRQNRLYTKKSLQVLFLKVEQPAAFSKENILKIESIVFLKLCIFNVLGIWYYKSKYMFQNFFTTLTEFKILLRVFKSNYLKITFIATCT